MPSNGETSTTQSQQRIEELIEFLPDIVLLVAPHDTCILGANAAALSAYGYSREELLSLSVRKLRAPETQGAITGQMALADAAGTRFETVHRRKNGTTFPVEVSSRGATLGGERILLSVVRDISERVRAEAAYREMSERLRLASKATREVIWDWDIVADAQQWNESGTEVFGWTDIVTQPQNAAWWVERVHPDDRDRVDRNFFAVVNDPAQDRWHDEYRFQKADGSWAEVLDRGYVLRDDRGNAIRMIGSMLDVTERVRAEEALSVSEEKFKKAFMTGLDAIYIAARDEGRVVDINNQFVSVFGYERDEAIGKTSLDLNLYEDPSDRTRLLSQLKEKGFVKDLEMWGRNKNGDRIRVSLSINNLFIGNVPHILGVARDVTERERARAQKEDLENQLRQSQKMESIGRLAGGVAHDFNNMLSIIQMSVQHAIGTVDPSLSLYGDLTDIRTAANRSAELTQQLLAFARRQTIAPRALDLNESIGGLLKILRRILGENLALSWHPGSGLWPVLIDPSQVDQILTNLCVNARDAIADIGTVSIETSNRSIDENFCTSNPGFVLGDYVQVCMSDNGCGMDAETQKRIFEPFFTTKSGGKGTGLGLATVYGIVKQNNGIITVTSAPQQGTTFTIYLPRYVSKAAQAGAEQARPTRSGRETILVVEDESAILRLITRLLKELGYRVLATRTPGEAIRVAREHLGDIHLLLSDVVMPEMNGRDLAKNVLSLYPGVRCLFMSGYTADIIAHHGVLETGVSFIQKPFSAGDLSAKIREVLENAQGS